VLETVLAGLSSIASLEASVGVWLRLCLLLLRLRSFSLPLACLASLLPVLPLLPVLVSMLPSGVSLIMSVGVAIVAVVVVRWCSHSHYTRNATLLQ